MKKKLVLLLVVAIVATFALVACDQSGDYVEEAVSEKAFAIESNYELAEETVFKFGHDVVYPIMTNMENLSKSRIINGALSTRGTKIGSDVDGNPGMVFGSYEILIQNQNILSVKFYAAEKMNTQDEAITFLFAAGKDGKLVVNTVMIFGKADVNPNVEAAFDIFNTYRAEQGMEEITLNEFYFTIIAFEGEDVKDMDVIISYRKEVQNNVVIPFSELLPFLSEEDSEFFSFAK